jgi:hypothetical protein
MMGIILKSTMISFGIATIAYCINIALAQIDPSTGQSTTSLSQSAAEQPVAVNPASAGNISAPTVNISAPTVNISAPTVNSTTIGIPESPTIVGPSSLVASPITSEANGTNSLPTRESD